MNIGISKFRDIATSGQSLGRVKIHGENVVNGTKLWGLGTISKAVGLVVDLLQRQKNQQTYQAFKTALSDAYGEAGIASLTAHRPETDSKKHLSTDLIQSVIAQAEIDFKKGRVTPGPRAAISSEAQYNRLPELNHLSGGQIMIKKAFVAHGAVEGIIIGGQKAWTKLPGWLPGADKESNISTAIDGKQVNLKARFLGHGSSEHAGIALDTTHIGEAVGEGLRSNDTTGDELRETKYVVYEPIPELRLKMKEVAERLLERPGEKGDGAYSAVGAFSSMLKPRINSQYQHDLMGNVKFDGSGKAVTKEGGRNTLAAARAYLNGTSDVRPDVFCSEFAALCLELATEDLYGKSASGQDPNAVSPMHLEDLVHSRPDLFSLAGRYEGQNAQEVSPSSD